MRDAYLDYKSTERYYFYCPIRNKVISNTEWDYCTKCSSNNSICRARQLSKEDVKKVELKISRENKLKRVLCQK